MPSALMLGDADCVESDVERALALFKPDVIAATSNAGLKTKLFVDYWVSLHPLSVFDWIGFEDAIRRRVGSGLNRPQTWSCRRARGVDRVTDDWSGSSGLFGVKVLLEEEIDRIVLAGVPMTRTPHFYGAEPWHKAGDYHKGWLRHHSKIAPFVRSMSGWTQELLGSPTAEWLNGSTTCGAGA